MTKKSLILAVLFAFVSMAPVKADEGMWLPMLIKRLNQRDLQKMGLQLTPEEIYSVNNASLKDAIVSMGGFCTGEIVSPHGLMFTNHHCGYNAINDLSTVEHDYLKNGFWARSYEEELPNEGLYVSFLVRMEDVTERVTAELDGIEDETERRAKIDEISQVIAQEAKEGTHYDAQVKSFFSGNEFYLFVYEVFRDVRLVGTPPESIGKFGGDTDNWMWPRQTGDFAIFRVYTAPDGSPAEYSPDNVPLKSKHFLPVSIAGIEEGGFAMTAGYGGSTQRYLTSYGVEQALEKRNPTVVEIREAKLAVLDEFMKSDDALRLMYASSHAQIANYWKYYIGQSEQLKHLDVKGDKEKLEAEFREWASANPERKAKYGDALEYIRQGFEMTDNTVISGTYVVEAGLLGPAVNLFAYRLSRQLKAYADMEDGPDKERRLEAMKSSVEEFFENHHMPTDKALFEVTNAMYAANVPEDQLPDYLKEAKAKYTGKWDKYADRVYSKSFFTDRAKLMSFLDDFAEKPDMKKLEKDPIYRISNDLFDVYLGRSEQNKEANNLISKGMRLFEAGLQEMMPDKDFYPDANSTMRFSFGTISGYAPKDGVHYDYYTTLEGVMEKMDPDDDEFVVPAKLVELYEAKDYGPYANDKGELPVNFISNNDITGGNSGSPVMNGRGELIGLAFDGNWEAMSGDINFEPNIQRTISVDVRYVLFVIDKFAGAQNIIDELQIVKNDDTPTKNQKIKNVGSPEEAPAQPTPAQ